MLIGVTTRAISLWVAHERGIPGPVAAYLRLLSSLPKALQEKELTRIRKTDPSMYEGMYQCVFQGASGPGLGVFVLSRGTVFGSDGAVQYDGVYKPSARPGYVDLALHLSVPPGVALVQGVPPQPMSYSFDVNCSFPIRGTELLTVQTPYGPVLAEVKFLRTVPN